MCRISGLLGFSFGWCAVIQGEMAFRYAEITAEICESPGEEEVKGKEEGAQNWALRSNSGKTRFGADIDFYLLDFITATLKVGCSPLLCRAKDSECVEWSWDEQKLQKNLEDLSHHLIPSVYHLRSVLNRASVPQFSVSPQKEKIETTWTTTLLSIVGMRLEKKHTFSILGETAQELVLACLCAYMHSKKKKHLHVEHKDSDIAPPVIPSSSTPAINLPDVWEMAMRLCLLSLPRCLTFLLRLVTWERRAGCDSAADHANCRQRIKQLLPSPSTWRLWAVCTSICQLYLDCLQYLSPSYS